MFGKKIAKAIDSTAAKAYETGTKVGGKTGGKIADALSNAALGGLRSLIDQPCTCTRSNCKH
ncbi:hypothetical protein F4556_003624 [Kitasatospora gansuensis]|uniref:Uncharacterized protein n=1 Tax=Kitasatospora gansuensis TaxID=258050 RepID=A0A7W7WIZ9_9ACTN|nr:hypothetical protein [Kitasatospora gansuensis]MBB4948089.1 hypothetical protein [Kitasatospora gansuensis]